MKSRTDLNAVGTKRPFAKPLGFAEFPFGKFGGRTLIGGIHLQHALADFDMTPVAPEHVLHEADDELRHAILPAVDSVSSCFRPISGRPSDAIKRRNQGENLAGKLRNRHGKGSSPPYPIHGIDLTTDFSSRQIHAPASGRLAAAIATNRAIPRLIRDGVLRSNERTRSIEISSRGSGPDSNIRTPLRRAFLRMLESKDHYKTLIPEELWI